MLRYVCRRLLAAIPIILGVLLITFVLFHCAAGDPAALMAGKNASARELQELRQELKLDRPLLYGHWRRCEIFKEQLFGRNAGLWSGVPGCEWRQVPDAPGYLHLLPGTAASVPRQWEPGVGDRYRLVLRFRGELTVQDQDCRAEEWAHARLPLSAGSAQLTFLAGPEGADLAAYRAEEYQANSFDSQFVAALREIVDWRRDPESGGFGLSFFNFGNTVLTREPIKQVLRNGVGPSLALMTPIFVIELGLALFIAMVSAYWRDRWVDRFLVFVSVAGMSVSYLVYILVGQYYLGYYLDLFPVWGYHSWRNLILPVTVGVISGLGGSVRFYRSVFLNELYREHVRTALAKGCSTCRLLAHHVFPNALIPVITRVAVVLPFLYTGSLLLESFVGIPGLGYAGVNALANADLQLLKALVILGSFLFVAANIIADIGYALVDPRVKLR